MPAGFKRSRALWDATADGGWKAWAKAICYELQPIRLSKSNRKQALEILWKLSQNLFSFVLGIPGVCKAIVIFLARRSLKQWMVLGAVVAYYYFIRWVHEALDAGPVVLILTALTLIFTIGLSDDQNRDGLSAYAVFNKGFEQLMGSIDADSLMAQHVGGGMMMNMNHHRDHNENIEAADDAPRPRHRDQANNRPVANDGEENVGGDDDNNNNNNNNRARRSGKKARRRDLDQRREIRRQREVAMQIGLGDGEDAVAMQRIIEEQIAAENHPR